MPIQAAREQPSGREIHAAVVAIVLGVALLGAGQWLVRHGGKAQQATHGARIYADACAGCHGINLEGQPPHGQAHYPVAPPLDASGHAWQHPDALLARVIAKGSGDGAMPGFAARLGPAEIAAVLTFLKGRWPDKLRLVQVALDRDGEQALASLLRDPEWRLPANCPPAPGAANP